MVIKVPRFFCNEYLHYKLSFPVIKDFIKAEYCFELFYFVLVFIYILRLYKQVYSFTSVHILHILVCIYHITLLSLELINSFLNFQRNLTLHTNVKI